MSEPTEYDRGIHRNTEILLEMIRKLELRIIELEKNLGNTLVIQPSDSYYWEHG